MKKLAKCITEEPDTDEDKDNLDEAMGWFVLAIENNVAYYFNDTS